MYSAIMVTCSQMWLHILLALMFFILVLPSTLSMSLPQTETYEPSNLNRAALKVYKRHISGTDPWSICPHTMERVACFYEYLRFYARLRKAVEVSNSVSVRNIGKRSAYFPARRPTQSQMKKVVSSPLDLFLVLLNELNKGFKK